MVHSGATPYNLSNAEVLLSYAFSVLVALLRMTSGPFVWGGGRKARMDRHDSPKTTLPPATLQPVAPTFARDGDAPESRPGAPVVGDLNRGSGVPKVEPDESPVVYAVLSQEDTTMKPDLRWSSFGGCDHLCLREPIDLSTGGAR